MVDAKLKDVNRLSMNWAQGEQSRAHLYSEVMRVADLIDSLKPTTTTE